MADSGSSPPVASIPTTMGWLREAMNGLVVLASGILTFGAGLYKDLALGTIAQKVFFVSSALALLATILCGVFCTFWLNRYTNLREVDSASRQPATDQSRTEHPEVREMPAPMRRAQKWYHRFYYSTLFTFCASMFLITTFLLIGVSSASALSTDKKDCQACSVTVQPTATMQSRYTIVKSAPHGGPRGAQVQHTFLLDQSTGTVWQMFCVQGGEEVEFRKIQVQDVRELKGGTER
jgi:hypothetical protein